jgi:hypothetical protein
MKPTTMRDPGLDFQPRRPKFLTLVLFAAAVLLAGDAAFEEFNSRARLEDALQQTARAETRRGRAEAQQRQQQPESLLSAEQAAALRVATGALAVEWERLFLTIDQAVGEDVALLAIRPSLAAQSVQISGEARDMAAALAFADALRRAPLARVVLLSHSVRINEPGRPIAFEISAEWNTGKPASRKS